MEIVVCVKRVPETAEAEVRVDDSGKGILTKTLSFDANEADRYALEEALRIKEKVGGTVSVVTVSTPEADPMLRTCLAKGADKAFLVSDAALAGADGLAVARALAAAISPLKPTLVLCGTIATDDGAAIVPAALAAFLGLPYATMVSRLELDTDHCRVSRELEGGLAERLELHLPALVAVQTGINEPRYASLRGMRKARETQIPTLGVTDIGLGTDAVRPYTVISVLARPEVQAQAQAISGTPEEVAGKLCTLFKEKGVL